MLFFLLLSLCSQPLNPVIETLLSDLSNNDLVALMQARGIESSTIGQLSANVPVEVVEFESRSANEGDDQMSSSTPRDSQDSNEEESQEDSQDSNEESSSDDSSAQPPNIFPKACLDESIALMPYNHACKPPTHVPKLNFKIDCDSIYSASTSYRDLIVALGAYSEFSMPMNTNQWKVAFSSRFSFHLSCLPEIPCINGSPANNAKAEMFPNVHIGSCFLKKIGVQLQIYIFDVGVRNLRKSGMFTVKELAVINAAMNMSVCICSSENGPDEFWTKKFNSIRRVVTPIGPREWASRFKTLETNQLNPTMMSAFARNFHVALDIISRDESNVYNFHSTWFHGMNLPDNNSPVSRPEMVAYAASLKKNCIFIASAAGTKAIFDRPDYVHHFVGSPEILEKTKKQFKDNYADILEEYKEVKGFDPSSNLSVQELDEMKSTLFDLPSFSQFFPDYYADVEEEMAEVYQRYVSKIYKEVRDAIGKNESSSDSDILFYVDIAVEGFGGNGQSFFLHTENSYQTLRNLMKIR